MSPTAGHATDAVILLSGQVSRCSPAWQLIRALSQMRSRRARRLPARRAVRTTSARFLSLAAMQFGLHTDDLVDYAARKETRHEHLAELRTLYSFRTFSGRGARKLKDGCFGKPRRCRTRILPVASWPTAVAARFPGIGSSFGCIRCRSGAVPLGSGVRRLARADTFAKLERRQRILGLSRCSPGKPVRLASVAMANNMVRVV